jgi:hypothetical protein
MKRSLRDILIAGWIMVDATAAHVLLAAERHPRIAIVVRDCAEVEGDVLNETKRVAADVLGRAGLEVVLTAPGSPSTELPILYASIWETGARAGVAADALGLAPGTEQDRNRYLVYVFKNTARHMVEMLKADGRGDVSLGTILGYAMAHEIGHVLLNIAGHSSHGVMTARWTVDDLKKMPACFVNFDSDQAAKIRNEVRRRTQDLQSKNMTMMASHASVVEDIK